jgi:hypothetical protein
VLGRVGLVIDPTEKLDALKRFTNHLGRFEETRRPTERELKATAVLARGLREASAKVRTRPPIDDEADYAAKIWAGVVPLFSAVGQPMPDKGVAVDCRFDMSRPHCESRAQVIIRAVIGAVMSSVAGFLAATQVFG